MPAPAPDTGYLGSDGCGDGDGVQAAMEVGRWGGQAKQVPTRPVGRRLAIAFGLAVGGWPCRDSGGPDGQCRSGRDGGRDTGHGTGMACDRGSCDGTRPRMGANAQIRRETAWPGDANFVHGARLPRFSSVQVNIANPSTGCQKLIDIEDERKLYVRNRWTRLDGRSFSRLGSVR